MYLECEVLTLANVLSRESLDKLSRNVAYYFDCPRVEIQNIPEGKPWVHKPFGVGLGTKVSSLFFPNFPVSNLALAFRSPTSALCSTFSTGALKSLFSLSVYLVINAQICLFHRPDEASRRSCSYKMLLPKVLETVSIRLDSTELLYEDSLSGITSGKALTSTGARYLHKYMLDHSLTDLDFNQVRRASRVPN